MRGEDKAYAVLGLRPGAPRDKVDEAYRRLIKIHHPDRAGGDGGKAAEINRAYTLIRQDVPGPRPRRPVVPVPPRRRKPRRRPYWLFILALVLAGGLYRLLHDDGPRGARVRHALPVAVRPAPVQSLPDWRQSFDDPLQVRVIDSAIATAMRFHFEEDMPAAAEYSRDCHDRLHSDPSIILFDACTAFDEAAAAFAAEGPVEGADPFSLAAVMSREMAGARALGRDTLGAELRIQRIRSRVELSVMPRLDRGAGPGSP